MNKKGLTYKKAWLSGFLDGEGCFTVSYFKQNKRDYFQVALSIRLRADDAKILKDISKMFNDKGELKLYSADYVNKYDKIKRSPVAFWRMASISDLYEDVIPVLDKYPLLSKKKRDYKIWREIVVLLYKTKYKKNSRNKVKPKLINLVRQLHEIKKYK